MYKNKIIALVCLVLHSVIMHSSHKKDLGEALRGKVAVTKLGGSQNLEFSRQSSLKIALSVLSLPTYNEAVKNSPLSEGSAQDNINNINQSRLNIPEGFNVDDPHITLGSLAAKHAQSIALEKGVPLDDVIHGGYYGEDTKK